MSPLQACPLPRPRCSLRSSGSAQWNAWGRGGGAVPGPEEAPAIGVAAVEGPQGRLDDATPSRVFRQEQ